MAEQMVERRRSCPLPESRCSQEIRTDTAETMSYEDRIVCLIDILGFSERVRGTVRSDGGDDQGDISAVVAALRHIRETLDVEKPEERPGMMVTQFSDSVVISFDARKESGVFYALNGILLVQIGLVMKGFLCRGAITRGKLIHSNELLMGPAFLQVYELETKAAIYPRVILDESIITAGEAAAAAHHRPDDERRGIESIVSKDSDGMYYVDYVAKAQAEMDDPDLDLPSYLCTLTRIAQSGQTTAPLHVAIKYMWLLERLRPEIRAVKDRARRIFTDPDILNQYADIPDV
jgi:hypothetical protein